MRIADSSFAMASARNLTRANGLTGRASTTSTAAASFSSWAQGALQRDAYTAGENDNGLTTLSTYDKSGSIDTKANAGISGASDAAGDLIGIRNALLQELLKRMLSAGMYGGLTGAWNNLGLRFGFGAGGMTIGQTQYYETEQTSFSTVGYATTEDGRTIDFDVNLTMTRSFIEYTQIRIPQMSGVMIDPLMINVGAGVANISDQTFKFDLDMDGEEEEISMLGQGTGFLALDLNGDGVINDGGELFGVKSGNGFEDLAAYDTDGNGWIDENDEIFDKLRVWYKNADGTDELIDLKSADIGAINLGYQSTDFSLYGAGMQMNGMVRSTGFFLRESGGAGTVQHVDLATRAGDGRTISVEQTDEGAPESATMAEGVIVVNTNGGAQSATDESAQSLQKTQEQETESEKEAKRTNAADEAARKKERQKKALEETARRKAQTERYYERRRLQKEQLEKIFEDRAATRKEMNDAAYEEQVEDGKEQERMILEELEREEQLDDLLEEQLEIVA